MPKTDLVPCFFLEQDDTWEKPAKVLFREHVRRLKEDNLGRFENHGRTFRLFESQTAAIRAGFFDGPVGVGNVVPFSRIPNGTEKHSYPIPSWGDNRISWFERFMEMPVNKPADAVAV